MGVKVFESERNIKTLMFFERNNWDFASDLFFILPSLKPIWVTIVDFGDLSCLLSKSSHFKEPKTYTWKRFWDKSFFGKKQLIFFLDAEYSSLSLPFEVLLARKKKRSEKKNFLTWKWQVSLIWDRVTLYYILWNP